MHSHQKIRSILIFAYVCNYLIVLSVIAQDAPVTIDDQESHFFELNYITLIEEQIFREEWTNFGESIALVPGAENSDIKGWIYIGAPNSSDFKTTPFDVTFDVTGSKELLPPGLVWRCRLENSSSSVGSDKLCEPIDLSNGGCTTRNTSCGDRTGSSLSSSSDKAMVICAPNWNYGPKKDAIDKFGFRIEGRCFFLDHTKLTDENLMQVLQNSALKLQPFFDGVYKVARGEYALFDNSTRWYTAQAGISSHITQGQSILLGAPGVLNWNGTVVVYHSQNSSTASLYSDNNTSILLPSLYDDPEVKQKDKTADLGLFGYAVTSGKYGSCENVTFMASGSPRGYAQGKPLMGIVLLKNIEDFTPVPSGGKKIEVECIWKTTNITLKCPNSTERANATWKSDVRLEGEDFGSYFGSVLESVDTNGDGIDELFVGAPFQGLAGTSGNDNGCVFIYNLAIPGACGLKNSSRPTRLCGRHPGGRFGSAIGNLKDINIDGYNDVIISAPYEVHEKGNGTVYIYFGSSTGITDSSLPNVTIQAGRDKLLNFAAFGQSVTGGVDIDGNGTPDFAVGDFSKGKVAIFRTRPKLKIVTNSTKIFVINETVQQDEQVKEIPTNGTKFVYKVCSTIFLVNNVNKTSLNHTKETFLNSNDTLPIRIGVSIMDRRFNLTVDKNISGNITSSKSWQILFVTNMTIGKENCIRIQAERPPLGPDELDEEEDLNITRKFWYDDIKGKGQFVTTFSIRNATANSPTPAAELTVDPDITQLCSSCPLPMVNRSISENIKISSPCKSTQPEVDCKADLSIDFIAEGYDSDQKQPRGTFKELSKNATTTNFILGSVPWLNIRLIVRNSAKFYASRGPKANFELTAISSSNSLRTQELAPKSSSNSIPIANILGKNRQKEAAIWLDMRNLRAIERKGSKLVLTASVNDSRGSFFPGPNFTLNYIVNSKVHLQGHERSSTLRDSGIISASFPFTVELNGSRVDAVNFEVLLPNVNYRLDGQTTNEKIFSFNNMKTPNMICTLADTQRTPSSIEISNLANLFTSPSSPFVTMKRAANKTAKEIIDLDCNNQRFGNDHCTRFKCQRQENSVETVLSFSFTGDLAQSLTKELFDSMNSETILRLKAKGIVTIFDGKDVDDIAFGSSTFNWTKLPETGLELWKYIASGIGGLLFLILIIIILCYCGFFKRDKKEELEELKAQHDDQQAPVCLEEEGEEEEEEE